MGLSRRQRSVTRDDAEGSLLKKEKWPGSSPEKKNKFPTCTGQHSYLESGEAIEGEMGKKQIVKIADPEEKPLGLSRSVGETRSRHEVDQKIVSRGRSNEFIKTKLR